MNQKSFEALTRDQLRNIEGGSGDPVCYNNCLFECNRDCDPGEENFPCADFCFTQCADACGY